MVLRLAVFDFDLTLSVEHVYQRLATTARSESGQLALINELNEGPHFRAHGGFAQAMMGGSGRVSQLSNLLGQLHSSGAECIVCTKGLVGPVRKILDEVGLLRYFSDVYGNTAEAYGKAAYDATANPGADARYLAGPQNQLTGSKQQFLRNYMNQRGLGYDDVVFIDDTLEEVTSMQQTCKAIHVLTNGMGPQTFAEITRLAAAQNSPTGSYVPPSLLSQAGFGFSAGDASPFNLFSQAASPAPASFMEPRTGSFIGAPFSYSPSGPPPLGASGPSGPLRGPPPLGDSGQGRFFGGPEEIYANANIEVFSRQYNSWCPGVIDEYDGPMVKLRYVAPDGSCFAKATPKGHPELRSLGISQQWDDDDTSDDEENHFSYGPGGPRRPPRPKRARRSGPCCSQ